MTENKLQLVQQLVSAIPELTAGQLHWLQRVVIVFGSEHNFVLNNSDIFDEVTVQNFGDAMRVHHSFSAEPFSKDKFEYVLVQVLNMSGHKASLAPKGNPGHDATIDGVKVSLKTQANKNIKENILWISKFMELGKGQWRDDPKDLENLRDQFLTHMKSYQRILSLRALTRAPHWRYELVEIPKQVLTQALNGELEMMAGSTQFPKPGYCYVRQPSGELMFELYFDAGSERKLQIKNLRKDLCHTHAIWDFVIPAS